MVRLQKTIVLLSFAQSGCVQWRCLVYLSATKTTTTIKTTQSVEPMDIYHFDSWSVYILCISFFFPFKSKKKKKREKKTYYVYTERIYTYIVPMYIECAEKQNENITHSDLLEHNAAPHKTKNKNKWIVNKSSIGFYFSFSNSGLFVVLLIDIDGCIINVITFDNHECYSNLIRTQALWRNEINKFSSKSRKTKKKKRHTQKPIEYTKSIKQKKLHGGVDIKGNFCTKAPKCKLTQKVVVRKIHLCVHPLFICKFIECYDDKNRRHTYSIF